MNNKNQKYVKVMFGTTSGASSDITYKLNEINIAKEWHPSAKKGRNFGGFNFSTEDKILRWLHRDDTIYDVEIPENAEVVDIIKSATPHGVLRSNKIIISNPRSITDDMALEFYKKSTIPEIAYYKSLGAVSVMNYKNTAMAIFRDKVNKDNIELVLEEWNDFLGKSNKAEANETVKMIDEMLHENQSNLLISINIDKDPYIKEISKDKVINLTGESGSGKSYFSSKYIYDDNFIVIDTDLIFGNQLIDDKYNLELKEFFKDKEKDYLITNFDECYKEILKYFKDSEKTIVIDSAQFRNIKDYSILKGTLIVMRTSIDTCYNRCINRWKTIKKVYAKEELEKYSNKKLGMYTWYKSLNTFLKNIDKL